MIAPVNCRPASNCYYGRLEFVRQQSLNTSAYLSVVDFSRSIWVVAVCGHQQSWLYTQSECMWSPVNHLQYYLETDGIHFGFRTASYPGVTMTDMNNRVFQRYGYDGFVQLHHHCKVSHYMNWRIWMKCARYYAGNNHGPFSQMWTGLNTCCWISGQIHLKHTRWRLSSSRLQLNFQHQ